MNASDAQWIAALIDFSGNKHSINIVTLPDGTIDAREAVYSLMANMEYSPAFVEIPDIYEAARVLEEGIGQGAGRKFLDDCGVDTVADHVRRRQAQCLPISDYRP